MKILKNITHLAYRQTILREKRLGRGGVVEPTGTKEYHEGRAELYRKYRAARRFFYGFVASGRLPAAGRVNVRSTLDKVCVFGKVEPGVALSVLLMAGYKAKLDPDPAKTCLNIATGKRAKRADAKDIVS